VKHLLVLGAGTAGTMAVAKLRPRLPASEWRITVVDRDDEHHYQPGYLFVPFGVYDRADVVRPRSRYLPEGVELVLGEIAKIDPEGGAVTLADGKVLAYDQLIVATGTSPRPDQTPGMLGDAWRRSVHEFYTLPGAEALRDALATAASATASSWSTSRRSTARSPPRSPPSASRACWRRAASRSRPTSSSSASTPMPERWCRTTSARCPSTCWSRCP